MDNTILCYIDMFSMRQTFIFNDEKYSCHTADLYNDLTAFCYKEEVYKIHFFGDEKYIEGIIMDIYTDESLRYGQNIIEIEVN